jgi:VWFA-related protein
MRISMKHSIGLILCWLGILLVCAFIPRSYGQEKSSQKEEKQASKTDQNFTIRIGVEEVRLDAVVVDGRGRQITDLTAGDFEIFQDDQPREVLSSIYIIDQTQPLGKPQLSGKGWKVSPPVPTRSLERDQVHRVIAFVVDDLAMNFEQVHYARMALTKFVEKQMQAGDLVAIMRTSRGNSAIQMFLSDKAQLLARIDTVRWGENVGREFADDNLYALFEGQLSATSYCIRALKDMPGRKALMVLTPTTTLPGLYATATSGSPDYRAMYTRAYNQLADAALRAGVVINFLDIRGLEAPFAGRGFGGSPTFAQLDGRKLDQLNPVPQKTGGLLIMENNFFVNGIGDEVNNALKGYYILSYAPPPNTFKENRKNIYHRIKIRVKRRGAIVHTRDGFYGRAGPDEEPALAQNPLREAIFSPFQHTDLKVSLFSGYIEDTKSGYMLRSWLHLDAQDVNIVEKKGEGHSISLETVCVTSDINGYIRDSNIMKYEFRIRDENVAWVKEHGIRFSLFLPAKKPGPYYVRVAVKDQVSGKVGSAYQFVDIPDLKKGRLALSNIFVVNNADDAAWIQSGATKEKATNWFNPILSRDESRSPALRDYFPGDHFEYMSVIYNAKHEKEAAPELESQFVLFKDGAELMKSEMQPLDVSGNNDLNRIPIRRRLMLGDSLQTGDYVLQLLVQDKQRNKKSGLVSQSLSFQIPNSSGPAGDH